MHDAGKSVLCDNPRMGKELRRGFKRKRTHVYLMPMHLDVRQKPSASNFKK